MVAYFIAGTLKFQMGDGNLSILNEGKYKKFLKHVEQITFSGKYAISYITERAIF